MNNVRMDCANNLNFQGKGDFVKLCKRAENFRSEQFEKQCQDTLTPKLKKLEKMRSNYIKFNSNINGDGINTIMQMIEADAPFVIKINDLMVKACQKLERLSVYAKKHKIK